MTWTERSSRTSAGTTRAWRPSAWTSEATVSRSGTVRAASATSAPARARARATPRPIPRDAPVTSATWWASGWAAEEAGASALFVVVTFAPTGRGLGRGLVLLDDRGLVVVDRLAARQGERQAPRLEVDLAHHDVDLLVEAVALARVVAPRRREDVRDVKQAEDPRLELDEHAVFLHAADPAMDRGADFVALGGMEPRVVGELLQADRDAAGALVDVEHLDTQALVHAHDLAGMAHMLPRHLAHVEQRVDAAQVEERSELGDRLDRALDHLAGFPAASAPARLIAALGQRLLERGGPLGELAARPRRLGHAGRQRRLPLIVVAARRRAAASAARAGSAAGARQRALAARPAAAVAVLRIAPLGALDSLDARSRPAARVDPVAAVDALEARDLERVEVAARGRDQVVGDRAGHARDHDLLAEAVARHGDDAQEIAVAGHEQDRGDGRPVEHRLDDVDEHVHVGARLPAVADLVCLDVDGRDARHLEVAENFRREVFEVRVSAGDVHHAVLARGFDEERSARLDAIGVQGSVADVLEIDEQRHFFPWFHGPWPPG